MQRWVRLFVVAAVMLMLALQFVIVTGIGGGHGAARHAPASDARLIP